MDRALCGARESRREGGHIWECLYGDAASRKWRANYREPRVVPVERNDQDAAEPRTAGLSHGRTAGDLGRRDVARLAPESRRALAGAAIPAAGGADAFLGGSV